MKIKLFALGILFSLGFAMPDIPIYHMRVAKPGSITKTFLQDATKRGNDLTNNNGVTQISGNPGNAVNFVAASNQYLDIVSTPDLQFTNEFTIALFLYRNPGAGTKALLSKWMNAGQREYKIYVNALGFPTIEISKDGTASAATLAALFPIGVNSWNSFIVARYDGVTLSISVDMLGENTTALSGNLFNGTDNFVIAASENPLTNFLDGRIDGLGIWKRVLGNPEINQLYNGGAGLPFINFSDSLKNGLTAYYDFESQFNNYLPLIQVSGLEFTEVISVPGQHNNGNFKAQLYDTRDPAYASLRDTYNRLRKQQRIEIYDNEEFIGDPVYKGVITALPADLGSQEIQGTNEMKYLQDRKLMRYERVNDNAKMVLQRMTKTYQPVFWDDFNRTGIGAKWTATSGTWDILNGALRQSTADGTPKTIKTAKTWDAPAWRASKISVDIKFSSDAITKSDLAYIEWDGGNIGFGISSSAYGGGISGVLVTGIGYYDVFKSIDYIFDLDDWNHVDIILIPDVSLSTHYTANIYINNVLVLSSGFSTLGQASDLYPIVLESVIQAGGDPMYFDNFIFAPLAPALAIGAIDNTSENFDEVFNGDSQQTAIEKVCEKLGWQYRLIPRAGHGNTWLDAGVAVGNDYSEFVKLKEGDGSRGTILNLPRDEPSYGLATWLNTYGQSNDEIASNFVATKLSAFAEYGIVEDDYQDPRISNVAYAKIFGDNRLNLVSQALFSYSGRILDESWIIEQIALWQASYWANFKWAGLAQQRLRAGDYILLESESENLAITQQIVAITRRSGSAAVDLIFGYFPSLLTSETQALREDVNLLRRNFINRQGGGWSDSFRLTAGVDTDWYIYFHGQIVSVLLDIRSDNWLGGAMTVKIDGVDRTNALFGAATIGSDKHANDTVYLVLSGNHKITFNCNQAVLLFIKAEPKVLS